MEKSKESEKPVIFICDDVKEDWRENENGRKKPRKELINEFYTETGQEFLLYTTELFLEDAKALLSSAVKNKTITEVQDLQAEQKMVLGNDINSIYKVKSNLGYNIVNQINNDEELIRMLIELEIKRSHLTDDMEKITQLLESSKKLYRTQLIK